MKASEFLQNDQSTATEDALRRAVDTTPAFIHTARPDGYLDYFNRGWLDFLGKSLEDVCGSRWTESDHPEDVAAIVQKWHAALASGEPLEIEAGEHTYADPELFTAETPLGTYQGMTNHVVMSRTPDACRAMLVPRGSTKPERLPLRK
jgi:PAS domain S-box-containing protein